MRKPFIVFVLLCSALFLRAQIYSYRNYTEDNGLLQSYVYDINQDKRGFLFVATGAGISIFGGYDFDNLTTKDGLSENFITTIFKDSRNRMWLGHFEGGVTIVNENGRTERIGDEMSKNYKVTQITQLSDSTFIFVKNNFGLVHYNSKSRKQTAITGGLEEVLKIEPTKDELLILKSDGIYSIAINDLLKVNEPTLKKRVNLKNGADITANILKTKLIVADNSNGILVFDLNNKLSRIDSFPIKLNSSGTFIRLHVDRFENIYAGTNESGFFKINSSDNSILNLTTRNGLRSNMVQCLYVDREDNLWIGTYGKGLQQMSHELYNYHIITKDKQTVLINSILSLNGKIYAASGLGMGQIINGEITFINRPGLKNINYNNLIVHENTFYFSSEEGKLFRSDTSFRNIAEIPTGNISQNFLINALVSTKRFLYVCTSGGLMKFEHASGSRTSYSTESGLLHNNVKNVFLDSKERLWICSPGSPLHYMDTAGKIEIIKELPELTNFNINGIHEDSKKNLWLSTVGDGVIKYSPSGNKQYTISNGLRSNYCYGIIVDKKDNIWVAHLNGVSYKLNTKANFNPLEENSNLFPLNLIESTPSYDKTSNKLFFGANEGFLTVFTDKQKFNERPAAINMLSLTMNDQLIDINTDTIFDYNSYDIDVNFLGICLTDPSKVRYKYKLEGYDPDWQYLTAETRKITFQKVKDGNYSLKIFVANNDDLWNEVPLIFSFTVKEPFWKKAWFYILVGIVVCITVYIIIRVKTRALIQNQKELEGIIEEKTREISNEKEKIEDLFIQLHDKNKDLTDSINYAKRLQEAILPTDDYIKELFDVALFYKAKDIVSGDFYWFKKTENYSFAAVVDCTGHGVPGAFMSLIGATILDEIVMHDEGFYPSEILEMLDKKINVMLNQHSESGDVNKDGMEITLCKFDKKRSILEVSSAGRPFFLYCENQIMKIKSQALSIGEVLMDEEKTFPMFTHHVKKGDSIFMFSDGYTDQMGGPRHKKFSSVRLENFLTEIAELPTKEQERLFQSEFEKWKGEEDQTDDILIMNIRF